MPGIVGKAFVCKRCGNTEFKKAPMALYPNRTPPPEDWTTFEEDYLCPTCAIPFKRFMAWFFDEKDCPEKWREKE